MWRFGYDSNASFILTIALVAMLGAVLVWQKNRTGKTIHVWFWSAFFGVLLGFAGTFAIARLTDSRFLFPRSAQAIAVDEGDGGSEEGESGEGMGGGPGERMAGMGGGMGSGMGGGRGGFGGPRPKRDLTYVVRKVALLTGDVGLELSPEQATAFMSALKDIEQSETMTDEDAQAKHDALLAVLNDEQKAQLEAIGLPRGPRPGGGSGGSGGPGGGERPAEDANPFTQETNSAALDVLRNRFGGKE